MSSSAAMFLSAIVVMVFAMDQPLVLGQEYECLPPVWEVNRSIRSPVCSDYLPSARCCEGLSCESLIGCYPNPRQTGHPCSLIKPCTGDRCCAEGLRCQASATFSKPNTGLCVELPPTPIPTIAPTRRPTSATSVPSTVTPTKLSTSTPTPTRTSGEDAVVLIDPLPNNQPTSGPTEHPTTATFELIKVGPFGKCAGDCDNDNDCRPGLLCFQRSGFEDATVPGCAGTAEEDVDYCYDPSYQYPSSAPSLGPSVSPTSSPTSSPTKDPTREPSTSPTTQPSSRPSSSPSLRPSSRPSSSPSASPTDPSAVVNKETSSDPQPCPANPTQVNMGINEGANAQNTCSRSCECISRCCIPMWPRSVCLPDAPNDFISCMSV